MILCSDRSSGWNGFSGLLVTCKNTMNSERDERRNEPIDIRVAGSSIPTASPADGPGLDGDALVLECRFIVKAWDAIDANVTLSGIKPYASVYGCVRHGRALIMPAEDLEAVARDLEIHDHFSDRERLVPQGRIVVQGKWASSRQISVPPPPAMNRWSRRRKFPPN